MVDVGECVSRGVSRLRAQRLCPLRCGRSASKVLARAGRRLYAAAPVAAFLPSIGLLYMAQPALARQLHRREYPGC